MRYPRPRLGRPNSFSGRSLGKNFVAQTSVWSHLATMRPAVSSTDEDITISKCNVVIDRGAYGYTKLNVPHAASCIKSVVF